MISLMKLPNNALRFALVVMLTAGFGLLATTAHAQMDKKEKREWKKRKKKMSEEEFKELVEGYERLQGDVSGLNSQVSSLQGQLATKDQTISDLQAEVSRLEGQVNSARSAAQQAQAQAQAAMSEAASTDWDQGIVFKVQIGAFKNKELLEFQENFVNMGGEVDEEGTMRYTLAAFREYDMANQAKKYLRRMGVEDAWIVSYQDGQRVPLKDVLSAIE